MNLKHMNTFLPVRRFQVNLVDLLVQLHLLDLLVPQDLWHLLVQLRQLIQ
jgi:hypothetical protein